MNSLDFIPAGHLYWWPWVERILVWLRSAVLGRA